MARGNRASAGDWIAILGVLAILAGAIYVWVRVIIPYAAEKDPSTDKVVRSELITSAVWDHATEAGHLHTCSITLLHGSHVRLRSIESKMACSRLKGRTYIVYSDGTTTFRRHER